VLTDEEVPLSLLPKDEREATRLYKLAADQGSALAQANLRLRMPYYTQGKEFSSINAVEEALQQGLLRSDDDIYVCGAVGTVGGLLWMNAAIELLYEKGQGALPKDVLAVAS
jgi:TPR repeat protein